MEKEKSLVKDNPKLRRLNEERVLDTVDKVDNFLVKAAREKKYTVYYLLVVLAMVLILFGGAIGVTIVKSGNFNNFIDNMFPSDNMNKRIMCFNGDNNMTFRTPDLADDFKNLFNDSYCNIIEK